MLTVSEGYVKWVQSSGGIAPDGVVPVTSDTYITRIPNHDGSIIRPTFSWKTQSYFINDDYSYCTYAVVYIWEYLVLECGTFSWHPHVPGDPLPPNAIVTGHSATGDPYFSALAIIDGSDRAGMYDPSLDYALIPRSPDVKHVHTFSVLLFHKGMTLYSFYLHQVQY